MSPARSLFERVARFPDAHIWVVGDCMLDEYVRGDVERVSPEAPVPVVRARESFSRLGGAAHVAHAVAALGARVSLCGWIGKDPAGDAILTECGESGIDARAVGRVDDRPTTRKLRVLGAGQQLLRMDWEETHDGSDEVAAALVGVLADGADPTAIVVSDYAKGFVTEALVRELVAVARRRGRAVPVVVDPKHLDFARYRGATVLKPNLRELEQATGRRLAGEADDAIAAAAGPAVAACGAEAAVVTLGERGMLIVRRDGSHRAIASTPREVFDVTGAGDNVAATLALGLSVGASLEEAAEIANAAAGVAVTRRGARVVGPYALRTALQPPDGRAVPIHSRESVAERVAAWREGGRRIVFTNGCFDLLHAGHLSLLRGAAEQGDVLVVGLNSDASVRRLKGEGRPLVPAAERASLLAALDCVDAVVVFEEDTPLALLHELEPDVLVKGQDYMVDQVVGRELVEARGGRVVLVPLLPDRSTTALVEHVQRIRPRAKTD
ncbi:MAG: D-glycero-beta-D-manno-heptose 1-phosphate adenylyltransferase [Proteobacteria bacterium]|nr:D-glycero-beta-D-manno-heptose 1-phosphate adenylyltransferase [Pseudomonadota bacterium]